MIYYAVYDQETGSIIRAGQCHDCDAELQGTNVYLGRVDPDKDYIHCGCLRSRPAMPLVVTQSESGRWLVTGVPAGCLVTIEGQRYEVDDGEVDLSFGMPGRYAVQFDCPPFLRAEVICEN